MVKETVSKMQNDMGYGDPARADEYQCLRIAFNQYSDFKTIEGDSLYLSPNGGRAGPHTPCLSPHIPRLLLDICRC